MLVTKYIYSLRKLQFMLEQQFINVQHTKFVSECLLYIYINQK